jgi:putative heme-binding domain-containing protein
MFAEKGNSVIRAAILLLGCCFATSVLADELDYHVTDPELKVVKLDSSPDASFLSVRVDSEGRVFVGGRQTLFVYDLDPAGGYRPRHLLLTLPDHTWVNDIEIRGDDLYLVTVSAVYRLPGARIKRTGIEIERLLWGVPNGHVHQCLHACAWGPEGDLYVSMGDPLWYYGDFGRPDHWGYWTMYFRPEDTPAGGGSETVQIGGKEWAAMPYHGVGAVFRIRPDGTRLRSVSRGLRNSCGLCFDREWNLFTNDNDHEGLPSLYAPGRLLHVTDGSYFSWPRGWLQSKSPDRADILPAVNEQMGRAVPVLQTYYSDGFLPDRYDHSLLVARWCRRQVTCFPLEKKGNTFVAKEHVLLEGRDQARPVGVCVGRGGRVFVTLCYMAQNEGSPTYRSDLAVITRRSDPESMPFEAVDLTHAPVDRLLVELRGKPTRIRNEAFQELNRRREQNDREVTKLDRKLTTPAGTPTVDRALIMRTADQILAEARQGNTKHSRAPEYSSDEWFLLQLASLDIATRYPVAEWIETLGQSRDPLYRRLGVLVAGSRLTIPAIDARLSPEAPLTPQQKDESNVILYADEKEPIDLRKSGRVGNYTVAEHWKALKHTPEQEQLFALLVQRLDDEDDKVRLQAGFYLSLLNDPRSEPKIAMATADVQDKRLNLGKLEHLKPVIWTIGPIPDSDGFKTVHPVETTAIDLGAKYTIGGKTFEWQQTRPTSPDRPLYDFGMLFGPGPLPESSVYSHFRFESPTAERMQLLVGSEDGVKVWQNGKLVFENDVVRPLIQLDDVVTLNLQPGGNDILVRVRMRKGTGGEYFHYRHLGDVKLTIPEKPDGLSLADRLKTAGTGGLPIDPRFLDVDWLETVKKGDAERGRKLFAAESLGCAKCHAATPKEAGGGGPSLTDSGLRFTVPYLVESVLAPNKIVSPVFRSTIIETADGKVITGLVVAETAEKLEVLQPDTKRVTILKSNVDARKLGDVSAMPQGLVKTPEELRDVIAYLLTNPKGD